MKKDKKIVRMIRKGGSLIAVFIVSVSLYAQIDEAKVSEFVSHVAASSDYTREEPSGFTAPTILFAQNPRWKIIENTLNLDL